VIFGNTIEFVDGDIRVRKIVNCVNCKYYQGECCTRFGKQEHPKRDLEDYCSKGEEK